jgi:arsenate reductase
MAEGWTKHLKGDAIEAYSAGVAPHGIDPRAVEVMAEAGVDISGQRSKNVLELGELPFDHVVTLCGGAAETCPAFPGGTVRLHVRFDDPPSLAGEAASDDEALAIYRRVRDEIRAFVETLPQGLSERAAQGV